VLEHAAALAFDSGSFSGGGDVLTGEAARYHVNTASPRSSVKGLNVIPDREGFKATVVLPGDQHVPCVGVPLDGANGSPSEEFASEYAAPSACEKCQLMEGCWVRGGHGDS
jgi:hypothetical protein